MANISKIITTCASHIYHLPRICYNHPYYTVALTALSAIGYAFREALYYGVVNALNGRVSFENPLLNPLNSDEDVMKALIANNDPSSPPHRKIEWENKRLDAFLTTNQQSLPHVGDVPHFLNDLKEINNNGFPFNIDAYNLTKQHMKEPDLDNDDFIYHYQNTLLTLYTLTVNYQICEKPGVDLKLLMEAKLNVITYINQRDALDISRQYNPTLFAKEVLDLETIDEGNISEHLKAKSSAWFKEKINPDTTDWEKWVATHFNAATSDEKNLDYLDPLTTLSQVEMLSLSSEISRNKALYNAIPVEALETLQTELKYNLYIYCKQELSRLSIPSLPALFITLKTDETLAQTVPPTFIFALLALLRQTAYETKPFVFETTYNISDADYTYSYQFRKGAEFEKCISNCKQYTSPEDISPEMVNIMPYPILLRFLDEKLQVHLNDTTRSAMLQRKNLQR